MGVSARGDTMQAGAGGQGLVPPVWSEWTWRVGGCHATLGHPPPVMGMGQKGSLGLEPHIRWEKQV